MSSGFSITDQLNPSHAGVMEGYMSRADDAKLARASARLAPQLQFHEGDRVWIINPFTSSAQPPESVVARSRTGGNVGGGGAGAAGGAASSGVVLGPGPYDTNSSYRENWRPAAVSGRPVWIPAVVKEVNVDLEQIVVVPTIGPDVDIIFDSDVLPRDDEGGSSGDGGGAHVDGADRADNMIYLKNEHAAAILDNLQARFHADQPYTFANNAVLVAINTNNPDGIRPGVAALWAGVARALPRGTATKLVDIFDPAVQLLYAQEGDKPAGPSSPFSSSATSAADADAAGAAASARGGRTGGSADTARPQKGESALPPHIFSVAQQALTTLVKRKMKPQVIVVNGEAASGKSTTRKLIQDYLVTATCPGRDHSAVRACVRACACARARDRWIARSIEPSPLRSLTSLLSLFPLPLPLPPVRSCALPRSRAPLTHCSHAL